MGFPENGEMERERERMSRFLSHMSPVARGRPPEMVTDFSLLVFLLVGDDNIRSTGVIRRDRQGAPSQLDKNF